MPLDPKKVADNTLIKQKSESIKHMKIKQKKPIMKANVQNQFTDLEKPEITKVSQTDVKGISHLKQLSKLGVNLRQMSSY